MPRCVIARFLCCGLFSLGVLSLVAVPGFGDSPLAAEKPLVPLEQVAGPIPDDFVLAEANETPLTFGMLMKELGYEAYMVSFQFDTTPSQYRELQDKVIRDSLQQTIEQNLITEVQCSQLSEQEKLTFQTAFDQLWSSQLQEMMAQANVRTAEELDAKRLSQNVSSLAVLRKQREDKLLAQEYLRPKLASLKDRTEQESTYRALVKELLAKAKVRTVLDSKTDG